MVEKRTRGKRTRGDRAAPVAAPLLEHPLSGHPSAGGYACRWLVRCTSQPEANARASRWSERSVEAGEPTGAREQVCGPGVILTTSAKGAREGARVKIMLVGCPQTAGRASRSGAGLTIGRRGSEKRISPLGGRGKADEGEMVVERLGCSWSCASAREAGHLGRGNYGIISAFAIVLTC